ncbi:LysE family translocator [Alcaligenes sp. SDU_A2]|uniref:LysE family translocator n=1 Tax=Alcaligenes sp. SDU_A2 TaxID=3136634 RepID=UPI0031203CB7
MNTILYISYIATIAAIIATPGPNAALMVSHSMKYGKEAIFLNSIGSAVAASVLIAISLFFIDKIIPENAIPALSAIGSIYLINLGIKNLTNKEKTKHQEGRKTQKTIFYQSFITGISNPKDIIFFILFLPQFLDTSINIGTASTLLISGWIICDLFIMSCYGLIAQKSKKTLSDNHIKHITRAMGFIILSIGCGLAYHSFLELTKT